jgi:hypothetical protein
MIGEEAIGVLAIGEAEVSAQAGSAVLHLSDRALFESNLSDRKALTLNLSDRKRFTLTLSDRVEDS